MLAFPLTYMNDSGLAVRALARRYRIDDADHLVVVHDELDLPPDGAGQGRRRSRRPQRAAQHRPAPRHPGLRAGAHRRRQAAGGKERGGDHVLSRLPARQRELFDVAVQEAADAVELIVTDSVDAAMRRYNVRDARG